MKKALLIFSCFLYSLYTLSQPVANSLLPKVDKRVELLSIVFRLARPNEFDSELNGGYSKAIASHFNQYAQHSLITYFNSVADSLKKSGTEIAYWDVLALAAHLTQPPTLEPVVPFNSVPPDGWDNRILFIPRLVRLLQQFYHDAHCEAFFATQQAYYQAVNHEYERKGVKLTKTWFDQFFGLKTTENYYAIVGISSREGAYLRVDYKNNYRDTYTIFGCTAFDSKGVPGTFAELTFSRTMLHEYVHAYTNQLIDNNMAALQSAAEIIIANPKVYDLMKDTFYGNWQFVLYESMVRAGGIKYMMANEKDTAVAEREMVKQEKAGFFWIRGLVKELDRYESNRSTYANLESYMPELIKYFESVAREMKK